MALQAAVDKKAQLQKEYADKVKQLNQQREELQKLVAETAEECKQSRATLAEAKTRWDLVAVAFLETLKLLLIYLVRIRARRIQGARTCWRSSSTSPSKRLLTILLQTKLSLQTVDYCAKQVSRSPRMQYSPRRNHQQP